MSKPHGMLRWWWMLAGVCATGLVVTGCGPRTLKIYQADYINTGVYEKAEDRKTRRGDPLEVNIVCVHPDDGARRGNAGLGSDSSEPITSQEWFSEARRPVKGDEFRWKEPHARFRLSPDRIYVLTDDDQTDIYGTKKGSRLRGAKDEHQEAVVAVRGIQFSWLSLHDKNSVIYVFGRFVDEKGNLLRVPPARFHPPGDYPALVEVEVGVDKNRVDDPKTRGQYIRVRGAKPADDESR